MDIHNITFTVGLYLILLCKLSVAAIFAVAGVAKLADTAGTRKAIQDYGFSEGLAKWFAVVLPIFELLIVLFVLASETMWYGALGAVVLLTIFTVLMLVQLVKGNSHDCHCFGQIYSQAIGPKSVIKNLLMMVPAIVILLLMPRLSLNDLAQWLSRATDPGQSPGFLFGIAAIALLGTAVLYLKRTVDGQRIIADRLDNLEISGEKHEGHSHQHHEEMTAPNEGLPIGAPVPDFELPDINGRSVKFEQLMMRGKAMLFFFISPTCGPCKALLPEIGKWQEEFTSQIEFVFVSTGSVADNVAKLPQLGGQTLLLQKKREIAELFKTKWTPTALLVSAEGNFASRPAAGDTAIHDLIDLIREKKDKLDFVENGQGMSPNALKIGNTIPQFDLMNVNGDSLTDETVKGKRTLALFWGVDCPHCKKFLPEVLEWEKDGTDDLNVVVFSMGDVEANRALGFSAPLLIDEKNEIANDIGMFGTPSAVMIDEKGTIVSETAIGREQIVSLIGKRKLGEA